MEIKNNPFYELRSRLYACAAAGCGIISEDFRLQRALEAFKPMSEANKVFGKLYAMCQGLITSDDPAAKISDCIALADALAVTQGTFDTGAELSPLPECNGIFHELQKRLISFELFPVQPAHRIILAPGIVVAFLTVSEFVTCVDHGDTLAQQHHKKGISYLLGPDGFYDSFSGGAFDATVPGIIEIASVLVVFAVFLVVTVIIGYKVVQRKPVLAGHIINDAACVSGTPDMLHRRAGHALIAL